MNSLTKGLDKNQKKAVLHNSGPILVLAGAGSGKTRVLTHRIARLVKEKHCKPSEILALTFTNKAAREMQKRIGSLTSKQAAKAMTVSTFHSFGVKILREHGDKLGLKKGFTILNDNERTSTLKSITRSHTASNSKTKHSDFGTIISLAKNASISQKEYKKQNPDKRKENRIYKAYHATLLKRQAVDFDDLLLLPLQLFRNHPEVLEEYRRKYQFISLDEFQDTNTVQMRLTKLLVAPKNNLMVVGDDDQGIYSWRGAEIENIIYFNTNFKNCVTVILDKNYRSTPEIVGGAYGVIAKNQKRKLKEITAVAPHGNPILTYKADDEIDEVEWLVGTILENNKKGTYTFSDHAILFRTNALMRRFEEELRIQRIPYYVQGSMSFFDRKEVKDVFAYLNFFANTDDELSLTRILKVPNKGITKSSVEKLEDLAGLRKMSLWKAFERCEFARGIDGIQKERIEDLVSFYNKYNAKFEEGILSQTIRDLLIENGYMDLLKKAYANDKSLPIRLENIEEIIHGIEIYEKKQKKKASLHDYIQKFTLTFNDNSDDNSKKKGVILMTLHKSKGLEFPVVFLPVLDDAILPSPRSASEGNIEEERRLFYVGMTRAEKRLYLSCPDTKVFRKNTVQVKQCRFIREIPEEFLDGKFGVKEDIENDKEQDDFFAMMRNKFNKK